MGYDGTHRNRKRQQENAESQSYHRTIRDTISYGNLRDARSHHGRC